MQGGEEPLTPSPPPCKEPGQAGSRAGNAPVFSGSHFAGGAKAGVALIRGPRGGQREPRAPRRDLEGWKAHDVFFLLGGRLGVCNKNQVTSRQRSPAAS